jgi:hypothetical protein
MVYDSKLSSNVQDLVTIASVLVAKKRARQQSHGTSNIENIGRSKFYKMKTPDKIDETS